MNDFSHTAINPSVELIEPPTQKNYLEFLELCTRTCYKSEAHTRPGSAKKLMTKVVKDYEHYSVTEHMNIIIFRTFDNCNREIISNFIEINPLFAGRVSKTSKGYLISGNVRMWTELFAQWTDTSSHADCMRSVLAEAFPFFFQKGNCQCNPNYIKLIDANPFTNKDNLSIDEMMKHMTLTVKFIGARAFSHQLVRHRFNASYSQESTRYCNYGKKGFQFIIPPSVPKEREREFTADMVCAYDAYLYWMGQGLKPEDARYLLPIGLKTEIMTTFTLDMWAHCFHHRGRNKHAQEEIRVLFLKAEELILHRLGWSPYGAKYNSI